MPGTWQTLLAFSYYFHSPISSYFGFPEPMIHAQHQAAPLQSLVAPFLSSPPFFWTSLTPMPKCKFHDLHLRSESKRVQEQK